MKSKTALSLSLLLVPSFHAAAQQPESAPPATEARVEITAAPLVEISTPDQTTAAPPAADSKAASGGDPASGGGKLIFRTLKDGKSKVEVVDLTSADSADSPSRVVIDSVLQSAAAASPQDGPSAWLGVAVLPPSPELANHLPLAKGTGLVIQHVSKDSPASKAGLQENDILTRLDDQILIHPTQLAVLVGGRKEGDSVKLAFLRKGASQELAVTLAKNNDSTAASTDGQPATLRVGDVQIQIGEAGMEPLRTVVRSLKIGDHSPLVKELSLKGGIALSGDNLKIMADQILEHRGEPGDALKNRISKAIDGKLQAARELKLIRPAEDSAAKAGKDDLLQQLNSLHEKLQKENAELDPAALAKQLEEAIGKLQKM